MNVEEREAFWQFWVSRTDIADIPIVAAEMGFIAALSHRDKEIAESKAMKQGIKVLTVVIDPNSDECLYVDGIAWESTGETTVYACDIDSAAQGEAILFHHRHINWCFDRWPKTLAEALTPQD